MTAHKIFNVALGIITLGLAIACLIYGFAHTKMAKLNIAALKKENIYDSVDKKIRDKYDLTLKFYNLTITIVVLSGLLIGLSILSFNNKSKVLGGIKLVLCLAMFIVSVMLTYYGRLSLSIVFPVELDVYARYGFASGIVGILATVSSVVVAGKMLMK